MKNNIGNIIYIHQPNFLPWIAMIQRVFNSKKYIVLDNVQFTQYGYQNRSYIKSPEGKKLITIPVRKRFGEEIRDVIIASDYNKQKIIGSIYYNYKKTPYFEEYYRIIEGVINMNSKFLIDLNVQLIKTVLDILDREVEIIFASDLDLVSSDKNTRIKEILNLQNVVPDKKNVLLAGTGCENYINSSLINSTGFEIHFDRFIQNHPLYNQHFPKLGFIPCLSIIDTLFNIGAEKTKKMFIDYYKKNILEQHEKK